ncbi:hypothetical protein ACIPEL_36320 [Streptomyces griseoviridis]
MTSTAPAREIAQALAQQGKHSHLHAEGESTCISGHCSPTPAVLGTSLLRPADTRPAGFTIALAGGYL